MDSETLDHLESVWTIASILVQLEWIYQTRPSGAEDLRRFYRSPPLRFDTEDTRLEASAWQQLLDTELNVVTQALGIEPPPVTISRYVPNAASDGQRILLNPSWAREVTQFICKRDGPCRQALFRGIASHELAHHMREERVVEDQHAEELRADIWAAGVLTRLGTSIEPYRRLVGQGKEIESSTHPAPSVRNRAIVRGSLWRLSPAELRAAGSLSPRPEPEPNCCQAPSHPLALCVCEGEDSTTKDSSMDDNDDNEQEEQDESAPRSCAAGLGPLPKLDEYIEDLIDPAFGSYSSRQVVRASANKMLAGFSGILTEMRNAVTPPRPAGNNETEAAEAPAESDDDGREGG